MIEWKDYRGLKRLTTGKTPNDENEEIWYIE